MSPYRDVFVLLTLLWRGIVCLQRRVVKGSNIKKLGVSWLLGCLAVVLMIQGVISTPLALTLAFLATCSSFWFVMRLSEKR